MKPTTKGILLTPEAVGRIKNSGRFSRRPGKCEIDGVEQEFTDSWGTALDFCVRLRDGRVFRIKANPLEDVNFDHHGVGLYDPGPTVTEIKPGDVDPNVE